ncbi:MAG: DUF364 domain-containing protein [Candidatus Eremiobacteraeota bacterium]|nr:DUF364 domain-containing protein [Candidatus Eremiobacteraeota bacterium]
MRIIKDLIDSVAGDHRVRDVRACCYWTAVSSRGCGLASTFITPCPHHQKPMVKNCGKLTELSAKALAEYSLSDHLLEATLGMAALNSLIEVDVSQCSQDNAFRAIAHHSEGKKVVVVGNFPFTAKLAPLAADLVILQKPKGECPLPGEDEKRALREAEVAVITGTSLINHSLEVLLECINPKALKIMVGPTTPLSPVLFDHGFDYLSGIKVADEALMMRSISEGATFKEIQGVMLLTMKKNGK